MFLASGFGMSRAYHTKSEAYSALALYIKTYHSGKFSSSTWNTFNNLMAKEDYHCVILMWNNMCLTHQVIKIEPLSLGGRFKISV